MSVIWYASKRWTTAHVLRPGIRLTLCSVSIREHVLSEAPYTTSRCKQCTATMNARHRDVSPAPGISNQGKEFS